MADQYLMIIKESAIRRDLVSILDGGVQGAEGDYCQNATYKYVWLDPETLLLPPNGVEGTTDFLPLLQENVRSLHEKENGGLIGKVNTDAAPKPFFGVDVDGYCALIDRLLKGNLVLLRRERPRVIKGVFAVPKDDYKQRLIMDARPAIEIIMEPPPVKLPNPGKLAGLHLSGTKSLEVCKSNMDKFYHRLEMPKRLCQFFGLPAINIKGKRWWPVVRVLRIGWSQSVYSGQQIHETVVRRAGLDPSKSLQYKEVMEVGDMEHGDCIDGFFAIGRDKDLLRTTLQAVLNACEGQGIPAKISKVFFPGEEETRILGVMMNRNGTIMPMKEKLLEVLAVTKRILPYYTWSKKIVEKILGSWAWLPLLRRPLFSILKEVYLFWREKKLCQDPRMGWDTN